jgi:hypothetical protein
LKRLSRTALRQIDSAPRSRPLRRATINNNRFNYAPTLFAQTPEAEAAGLTDKDFKRAIERLLNQGIIENAPTKGSHGKHGGRFHLRLKQTEEHT